MAAICALLFVSCFMGVQGVSPRHAPPIVWHCDSSDNRASEPKYLGCEDDSYTFHARGHCFCSAVLDTTPPPAAHPTAHLAYRRDIDGLRALAVGAVVAFHAAPSSLTGGFVGVDIFFVISGFLITSILASEIARGDFSIARFYARRVKRIFPALGLVLAATLAAGWMFLLADEYAQLGLHVAGGAGFVSNLLLWSEANYFDNASITKPLLHLWSLGVEEQFYFVWPLMLWGAAVSGVRALWLVGAVIALSLVANLAIVSANPTAAFYSPATRFWELAAGGALALSPQVIDRIGRVTWLREAISALGFGLCVVAIVMFTKRISSRGGGRCCLSRVPCS